MKIFRPRYTYSFMSFDNSCHHIASALTFYLQELRVIEKQ